MDWNQPRPWIQVIGSIAVHPEDRESLQLRGSTRTLLAILVAAGPRGASIDEIASAYWTTDRPKSWRAALRAAIGHLQAQLPSGWTVAASQTIARLDPGPGWIDAWRLEDEAPHLERPPWVDSGPTFGGIDGIPVIEQATARVELLLAASETGQSKDRPGTLICPPVADRLLAARRVIALGTPEEHHELSRLVTETTDAITYVIGDRGLPLPFGPYAVAFPELRDKIPFDGPVQPDDVVDAWRLVADALAVEAAFEPQRLVVVNAHELDETSLELTSLLIERGPLTQFSILLGASRDDSDDQWLNFFHRASTAGCRVIDLGDRGD